MSADTINRRELVALLAELDASIAASPKPEPQVLCVFGGSAVLLYGSDQRQTHDIDVWRAASQIDDARLAQAAQAVGLDINPTDLDPAKRYLQVITEGVVRLPPYSPEKERWAGGKPSETVWSGEYLKVVAPPPELIAAAKLVRCDARDIDDIVYIMAKRDVSLQDIAASIKTFPASQRQDASENLTLLRCVVRDPSLERSRTNESRER